MQTNVWFEHVPSATNVADLPSRDGDFGASELCRSLDAAPIALSALKWPDPRAWVGLVEAVQRTAGKRRRCG